MRDFHRTDQGNAERLVEYHAGDLRYCAPQKRWYAWDGKRWEPDATGEVMRRAKDTVRRMLREAIDLPEGDDRDRAIKWAMSSETRSRLESMVRLTESERPVPLLPEQLDTLPWLLNCVNGTLDLRNGRLRGHSRVDLITRITPTAYDPDARDDRWTRFVEQVMPDEDVRRYVQKGLGYSITGTGLEGGLFLPYGPTHTGKTTMLETAAAALGSYAVTMDVDTLIGDPRHRDGGRARPDLIRLFGARLVISTEVPENAHLDAALVKKLTGGDSLWARTGYEFSGRETQGTFVIWLGSNHRPHVRDDDDAVWERVRQIPFQEQHTGSNRDKTLKPHLESEASAAVLAWLVEGARLYQEDGLEAPPAVISLTDAYRREMNPLTRWAEECCEFEPDFKAEYSVLRESYEHFTPTRERVGTRRFSTSLGKLPEVWNDREGDKQWHGIRLATDGAEHDKTDLSAKERLDFDRLAETMTESGPTD